MAYLDVTANAKPKTQHRRFERTGLAKSGEARASIGTGQWLASQESAGRVLKQVWKRTYQFLRCKPGPLADCLDPLLTLHLIVTLRLNDSFVPSFIFTASICSSQCLTSLYYAGSCFSHGGLLLLSDTLWITIMNVVHGNFGKLPLSILLVRTDESVTGHMFPPFPFFRMSDSHIPISSPTTGPTVTESFSHYQHFEVAAGSRMLPSNLQPPPPSTGFMLVMFNTVLPMANSLILFLQKSCHLFYLSLVEHPEIELWYCLANVFTEESASIRLIGDVATTLPSCNDSLLDYYKTYWSSVSSLKAGNSAIPATSMVNIHPAGSSYIVVWLGRGLQVQWKNILIEWSWKILAKWPDCLQDVMGALKVNLEMTGHEWKSAK